MKTSDSQYDADDDRTLDDEGAAENEQEETNAFHKDGSIAATDAASAGRFYARLSNELRLRGIRVEDIPRPTPDGSTPPCFKLAGVRYEDWLASSSLVGATVPYRYDTPAEPNYCFDCTQGFKSKAVAAGACQFPRTRFEKIQNVIRDEHKKVVEVEIVGVSRRKHLQFEGSRIDELLAERFDSNGDSKYA